jgi:asparagine synthase (glutamine-hydrolysing)
MTAHILGTDRTGVRGCGCRPVTRRSYRPVRHHRIMFFRYGDLRDSLVAAVREGSEGREVGVAFSGGLDSGLIAAIAKEHADTVTLYTCGADGSHDVIMARDLSERIGLPWVHIRISEDNVESLIREMMTATGVRDPFTISYELQLFCVCKASTEEVVLTGQGADEFFMGCAKFVDCPYEDYEILRKDGVRRLLEVSVPCEKEIAAHFGKSLAYPYLDEEVLAEVGKLDPAELRPADMGSRKAVLRDIAADLGYPVIAGRVKKSSQYGSGTTDIIRALAKGKRMLFNQYVESIHEGIVNGVPPADAE